MLNKLVTTLALLGAWEAVAFPALTDMVDEEELAKRSPPPTENGMPFPFYPGQPGHENFNEFDPVEQLVSTSGKHKFIAPRKGDIRGPCAGLNAAANHGYLPRNGIATAPTILVGLNQAFGVSEDLLGFLQTATAFFDGDPFTQKWSIGHASRRTYAIGGIQKDLLGKETGICNYGHLKTEGDASITRGDFLAPADNDNCMSYPKFMNELLALARKRTGGNLTPQVMAEHQFNRKKHSVATNPNYFSPAYAGVAFTFGAHMFAWQLLANHSHAKPRGFLTPKVFMDFFGYESDGNGNAVQKKLGHERIPNNWYRRSLKDQWTASDVLFSTSQQCVSYPSNCQVGGNTGEVNSFNGVDLGDVSGGFINSAEDLQDPAKLGCFISQAVQADVPTSLDGVFQGGTLALIKSTLIPQKLIPSLAPLEALSGGCPNLPPGKSVSQYGKGFPGGFFGQPPKKPKGGN